MTCRTHAYDSKLITAASEDGQLRCQCVSRADVHVDTGTYESLLISHLRLSVSCLAHAQIQTKYSCAN